MQLERWLSTWPLRWRSLVRRGRVEQDLDDELRYHVDEEAAALVARGFSESAARAAALRKFGGVEQVKEDCRDARNVAFIESLLQDVRYGARTLLRNPGFTAVAVLTLAIGIGANAAIFSVVDAVLFRPLPFPSPGQLVSVKATYPTGAVVAMRERVRTLDVAAYAADKRVNLTGAGDAVRLTAAAVSAELFSVLGARAAAGRVFRSGDDLAGQGGVAVLGHALWQRRFGGSPSVVGRSIVLDGERRIVVGVMPADFVFPSRATELWVPLHRDPKNTVRYWAGDFMPVIGRLRPGATLEEAAAEVRLFQAGVFDLFPWKMPAKWNADVSVTPLGRGMVADVCTRLLLLLGAVALVLLIACANVANLTLSRAVAREREIGVRATLGAAPARIARQMLTESVLLGLLGGAAGVLVASPVLALATLLLPPDTPRLAEVRIDWRVLGFAGLLSLAAGCLFGLAPVFHARRASLVRAMSAGGRAGARPVADRLRTALTVGEVAVAVLLVAAAGLLVRTLWAMTHVDPGFRARQVVTARITPGAAVCADVDRCLAFYRTLEEEAGAAAGATGAALVNTLPLTGTLAKRSLELEGYQVPRGEPAPLFWLHVTTPTYFDVMGIRLESGRAFSDADRTGSPTVIVSAAAARRFWPRESAVGKHVRFVGEREWRTVVGVAADVRAFDLTRDLPGWMQGVVYVPHGPRATLEDGSVPTELTLAVRAAVPESEAAALARRVVARLNPDVAVSDVRSMEAIVDDAATTPAATASLFAAFAGVALLLGTIGVYGVLAFLVSRRTHDIGVHVALGACPRDVSWMVLKEGARVAGLGIALGMAAALPATRLLSAELHGVTALDPVTYAGVTLVVAASALAACYVPTRRATRVDPLVALRDG
jgi:putative ABC transport system permease protein